MPYRLSSSTPGRNRCDHLRRVLGRGPQLLQSPSCCALRVSACFFACHEEGHPPALHVCEPRRRVRAPVLVGGFDLHALLVVCAFGSRALDPGRLRLAGVLPGRRRPTLLGAELRDDAEQRPQLADLLALDLGLLGTARLEEYVAGTSCHSLHGSVLLRILRNFRLACYICGAVVDYIQELVSQGCAPVSAAPDIAHSLVLHPRFAGLAAYDCDSRIDTWPWLIVVALMPFRAGGSPTCAVATYRCSTLIRRVHW
mmetsp:Transcript_91922/g.263277  ORF Transcript_91922/g.263277 Transcript_91922/m.263277 type:complete len:255 (-) Transcript_91922:127-891(-)